MDITEIDYFKLSQENKVIYIHDKLENIFSKYKLSYFLSVSLPKYGMSKFNFCEWTGLKLDVDPVDSKEKLIVNYETLKMTNIATNEYDYDRLVIPCFISRYIYNILLKRSEEINDINIDFCKICNINPDKFSFLKIRKDEENISLIDNSIIDEIKFKTAIRNKMPLMLSGNSERMALALNEVGEFLSKHDASCFFVFLCENIFQECFYYPNDAGFYIDNNNYIRLNHEYFKKNIPSNYDKLDFFLVTNFFRMDLLKNCMLLLDPFNDAYSIIRKRFLLH